MTMSHHLLANIVHFARLLRAAGIPVTPQQIADFVAALNFVDIAVREDVKSAARVTLVNRREHVVLFERAFELFWRNWRRGEEMAGMPRQEIDRQERAGRDHLQTLATVLDSEAEPSAEPMVETITRYSEIEILRQKTFVELTREELDAIKRLMQAMTWNLEQRPTRRKAPSSRGSYLDWRGTFRQNLRYGGEPLRLARRSRKRKRRPLVVICDVSGSMERYGRVLLQFIYSLSHGLEHVEAFVFSTRLTRITRQLRHGSVDQALDGVAAHAQDMGGGTQIGGALKMFNYQWGRRILAHGAIVLLISDGWDRGEPEEVRRQMERLQLNSRRLIWLNPLLGSPTYEPLTRGMQAALPYIDDFLPVHNLQSLEQLGVLLEKLGERRPDRLTRHQKPRASSASTPSTLF